MKTHINPNQDQWNELAQRKTVATADLNETVKAIFNDIQKNVIILMVFPSKIAQFR